MRKLILVFLLLAAVLLLSWWARGANFNLSKMLQGVTHPNTATPSADLTSSGQVTSKPTPTQFPSEMLISLTLKGFSPDTISIKPNTKVIWVNKSGMIANITSNPKDPHNILNIGDFGQNISVSVVFTTPGVYTYYNNKNTAQKGTITVK